MRYFIIFYNWTAPSKWGNGNMSISESEFPSREAIIKILTEYHQGIFSIQIVITNIVELNEKDYESWNK